MELNEVKTTVGTINKISYMVKDGVKENYYLKTVDVSKPKCWVEGFEYKFNSDIKLIAILEPPRKKKGDKNGI